MTNAPHLIITALLMLSAFLVGATIGAVLKSIVLAITRPRLVPGSDHVSDGAAAVRAALAMPESEAPPPPRIILHESAVSAEEPASPAVPLIVLDEPAISTGATIAAAPVLPMADQPAEENATPHAESLGEEAIVESASPAPPTAVGDTTTAAAEPPPTESGGEDVASQPAPVVDAEPAVGEHVQQSDERVPRPVRRGPDRPEAAPRGFAETMLAMTRGAVPAISTMPPLPPLPTYEQRQMQRRYAAMQPARKPGKSAAGMDIADPRSRPAEPAVPPRVTIVPMAEVIPFPLTVGLATATQASPSLGSGYPASVAAAIVEDVETSMPRIAKRPPSVVAVPFETDSVPVLGNAAAVTRPDSPVVTDLATADLLPEVVSIELPARPVLQREPAMADAAGTSSVPMTAAQTDPPATVESASASPAAASDPLPSATEAAAVSVARAAEPAQPRHHTEPGTGLPLGLESTLAEAIGATMELAPAQGGEVVTAPAPRFTRRETPPIALAAFDIVADDAPPEEAMEDFDMVPEFELVGFDIGPPAPTEAGKSTPPEPADTPNTPEVTVSDETGLQSAEEAAFVADLAALPAMASLDELLPVGPEPIDLERMRAALAEEVVPSDLDGVALADVPPDDFVAGVAQALLGDKGSAMSSESGAMLAVEGYSPMRRQVPRLVALTLDDGDDPALTAVAASGAAVAAATRTASAIVADLSPEPGRPAGMPGAREGRPDDLTHIIGVLPVIETALNRLGVFHFDQIAAWTDANVIWVESYLGLEGRISRELWRLQARELAADRPGLRSAKK